MKATYIACMIVLLSTVMVMPAAAFEPGECDKDVYLGDDIRAVVHSASEGDTICVHAGIYNVASFQITTPNLTLKGEGADVVTLVFDGEHAIEVSAPETIIDGLKIKNSLAGVQVGVYGPAPNSIVRNSIFEGVTGDFGVDIYAENSTFENNIISNSTGLLSLTLPKNGSKIINNTLINNTGGMVLYYPLPYDNGIITRNNIINNGGVGIWLYDPGEGNKIYLNNFVNNTGGNALVTYDAGVPVITYWNSTEPIEYTYNGTTYTNYLGNFWSDYSGDDGDGNGIGDTSHVLPESLGEDYRPLMARFENYPAPAPPVTPTPTPPPVSSGVSLGATIRPTISLVVAPDVLDFGALAAGQTSGVHTLTLSNTGGYSIGVSAKVNDTASSLFVNGLLLDSNAWGAYSASIASGGSKPAGASLKVPGDYAGVGAKEGTLVFWAEKS